jgi:hypothetical protein
MVVALVLGAALVLLSWWGAGGTARLSSQLAWVPVGMAGLVVLGVATAVWILVGRRAVRDRLAAMGPMLPTGSGRPLAAAEPVETPVAVTGTSRYHRPSCVLVRGKRVSAATASDHEAGGRRACPICRP